LPDKSKKVSEFNDPSLKVGKTVYQLGHASSPDEVRGKFNGGEREDVRSEG
jgi:hypothetical protein